MMLASDTNPDHENSVPALTATSDPGLEPFLAGSEGAAAKRTLASRLLDYSAHAAMIVGLVGFAWTVSNHVVKRPSVAPTAEKSASAVQIAPKPDELADLRRSNQQMSEDMRHLRSNLESLRASVREDKTPAQVRVLQAGLENIQSGLTATRTETAQINAKVEKIVHEPATKLQQLNDRVGKLEKTGVDMTSTGSIAPVAAAKTITSVPTPPVKPTPARLASAEDPTKTQADVRLADDAPAKQQVIAGYVVRDVYEGVALIEGRRGTMEVVPGVGIPGAGVVKSIDRKGNGWTVTTTKGLLAYATPAHDTRRSNNRPQRDFYPPYREDF